MAFNFFKPNQTETAFKFAKISGAFKVTGYHKSNKDGLINQKLLFDKLIEAAQFSANTKPSGIPGTDLLSPLSNSNGIPPITEARILEDFHYQQYLADASEWTVPDLSLVNKGNQGNTAIDPFLVAHPPAKKEPTFKVWLTRRTPGDVFVWPSFGMQSKISDKIVNYYMLFSYSQEGIAESVPESGIDLSNGTVVTKEFDYVASKFEEGTEKENLPAIFIYTGEFEAFLSLGQSIVLKPSENPDSFFEKRFSYYAFGFRLVYDREKINSSTDGQLIKNFYEIIPEPCMRNLTDDELINDLLKLLIFDAFSIFFDSSLVMIKILKNFTDLSVPYNLLHNQPKLTVSIFNQINGSEKTTEFCNFLTALSLVYQPVSEYSVLPVVPYGSEFSFDKSNFFVSDGMIRITVYTSHTEETGFSGDKEDPHGSKTVTTTVFDQTFNPLDLVILRDSDGQDVTVCALYVQYLVELAFWQAVVTVVVIVIDIISIFIAVGLIVKGVSGLVRSIALADIAISAFDVALQNEAFKAYLSKTTTGKWIIDNWGILAMMSITSGLSLQAAETIFKNADEAVILLRNAKKEFPELSKSIDEQIDTITKLKSQADEVLEGAALIKRGKFLGQALEAGDFEKIRKYLSQHKVDLQIGPGSGTFTVEGFLMNSGAVVELIPRNAAMFITDGKIMKMVLRESTTMFEFLHELMHFRHCRKLGVRKYYDLGQDIVSGTIARERFVFDKMVEHFKYLNKNELIEAEKYMNSYYNKWGITDNFGNPITVNLPENVLTSPSKRQGITIDQILLLK